MSLAHGVLFWITHPPVGASLLAIAVGQPGSRLNVPPSSRASSLPQGDGGEVYSGAGWMISTQ
ncbi:hypothetical protein F7R20_18130 [Pseudomonas brassicacearum subsp. brassicacearum]|nr:hypothetical protein F7R20_18130 [Pseudomonas brassicacearum subsp. brassicacearum]PJH87601.1 hypothetical protein CVG87_17570 [Pseudomonas sp. WCS365]QEO79396.1 hypothetical protein ELZ14_18200 [Pseudomonas brassicacearum]